MVNPMLKKILAISIMLQGIATSCFAGQLNANAEIPPQIRPPAGSTAVLTTHAEGYQIYQCGLGKGGYAWLLQAPDAKLLDNRGQVVGNHYSGPIWEYKEGSRIVGQIINKIDVDPDSSISWLLVKVIAHKGQGAFSNVSYINRINTNGGLPPRDGCDANHPGSEKRIAYTADYVFYE